MRRGSPVNSIDSTGLLRYARKDASQPLDTDKDAPQIGMASLRGPKARGNPVKLSNMNLCTGSTMLLSF